MWRRCRSCRAEDEVVVVVENVTQEEKTVGEIVEEVEQVKEVEESKIVREETAEEVLVGILAEEQWRL